MLSSTDNAPLTRNHRLTAQGLQAAVWYFAVYGQGHECVFAGCASQAQAHSCDVHGPPQSETLHQPNGH